MRPTRIARTLVVPLLLATAGRAAADEVTDALEAALAAWQAGDAATAKAEAEWALAKIGEAEAQGLAGFLPPAPEGWTRAESDSQALGAAMFGGGLTASAAYAGPGGAPRAEVTLAADGPMIAAMAAVLGNPSAMAAMGEPIRVGRHRAVLTREGELQALVGGRVLVSVSGDAPADAKRALFSAIDLDALAAR
jgi:hypothetical protein